VAALLIDATTSAFPGASEAFLCKVSSNYLDPLHKTFISRAQVGQNGVSITRDVAKFKSRFGQQRHSATPQFQKYENKCELNVT
jgi:hypothetical protein